MIENIDSFEIKTRQDAIKWLLYDYKLFLDTSTGSFGEYIEGNSYDFYNQLADQVMRDWDITIEEVEKYLILK
jgi:hypothetical protein